MSSSQSEPTRPERHESLGRQGCRQCGGTGWTEERRANGALYAVPCRCRRDYAEAIKRIGDLANRKVIDVSRPPGDRELSAGVAADLLAEARRILKESDDI